MAKKLLPVFVLLFLVSAGLMIHFKYSYDRAVSDLNQARTDLENERRERKAWENRQAVLLAERDKQIKELQQYKRDYERLKEEVVSPLRSELDKRKTEIAELQKQLENYKKKEKELKESMESCQKQLEEQLALRNELMPKLKEAEAALKDTKARTAQLESEKKELEQRLAAAQENINQLKQQLEKVKKLAPQISGLKIVGKVAEVIDPGKNIIISDFNKPPEVGLEFSVFRNSEFVGRARVYRVFENNAGAEVIFLQKGKEIKPGDVVRTDFQPEK